jgi:PIN domain nuclease of toxin-antitoxin system
MIYILDSSAMIAFLRDEVGAVVVDGFLKDAASRCFAHAVNVCEMYYDVARALGEPTAQSSLQDLTTAGVTIREDMDAAFWQDAGRIKAEYRRVSLADCFCIALARRVNGEVVTTDHSEFDPLVPLGLCPIRFIR